MAGFENISREGLSADASYRAARNNPNQNAQQSARATRANRNSRASHDNTAARSAASRGNVAPAQPAQTQLAASSRMNPVRRVYHIVTTVIMVVVVALAVALVGVRVVGLDVYTVLSGSMEPTYHTGSVIYVKSCDASEVQVGDPITFVLNEDLVVATHRVIEIDAEQGAFYTKGDANEAADGSPVLYENLIGKPVFSIPYLGYLADYVQSPPGMYVAIAACAVLILLTFLPDLFAKDEEEEASSKGNQRSRGKRGQVEGMPKDTVEAGANAYAAMRSRNSAAARASSYDAAHAAAGVMVDYSRAAYATQGARGARGAQSAQAQASARATGAYQHQRAQQATRQASQQQQRQFAQRSAQCRTSQAGSASYGAGAAMHGGRHARAASSGGVQVSGGAQMGAPAPQGRRSL